METKLNHRLPQTADRKEAFETGVENELRRRLQLTGSYGIVSDDGADVDNDLAPCAMTVNAQDPNAVDVSAGTVVFANGEYVEVSGSDIQAVPVDTATVDAQLFRLEYGEVDDGPLESNPYYGFAALPKKRKETAAEMLVVETVTAYNAQTADVKERSVVLGIARVENGALVVDNGRDTYTFSRPWFTPQDTEHRSLVGTGLVTPTNPHGTSINDLTVGSYTAWQAFVGAPPCVIARPNGLGRYPGEICAETIPSAAFATDSTGLITGVAGAYYAPLGFWPDRLLRCSLDSDPTKLVAAWFPKGRNVLAVYDPANFAVSATLDVVYTKVTAGSLPGSLTGLQTIALGQPTENEIMVAGGNFITEMAENQVLFTDVGLIPMKFDILVDNTGRAYKRPDVVYCNTTLEALGTSPQPFTISLRSPSRLRVSLSNYNVGYTEVRFLITGTDEAGATIAEQVSFGGAGSTVQPSFVEGNTPHIFTENVFASLGQIQVQVRNGDGANTTVTVFAEQFPERPETQDDLLLATLHWTGSEVTALYGNDANVALDRRIVTRGGGAKNPTAPEASLDNPMLVDTVLGYLPAGSTKWATVVENFADPNYFEYPNDLVGTQIIRPPVNLPSNSLGARLNYISRLIPFGNTFAGSSLDSLWMRMLPASMRHFPARKNLWQCLLTLYTTAGGTVELDGEFGTNPYPPYQVTFSGGSLAGSTFYGARVEIYSGSVTASQNLDLAEAFQGFIFHIRE